MPKPKRNIKSENIGGSASESSSTPRYIILGGEVEDKPVSPIEPYIVLEDDSYAAFLDSVKHPEGYIRILRAVANMRHGKFGYWKDVGEGAREIKIDCGPGYRIYYGRIGRHIILLVGGGDKSDQSSDIQRARQRLREIKDGIKKL